MDKKGPLTTTAYQGMCSCFPSGSDFCWVSSGGGDIVRVHGLGFNHAQMYRCRFFSADIQVLSAPAYASSHSTLECVMPPWPFQRTWLNISVVWADEAASNRTLLKHTLYEMPTVFAESRVDEIIPTRLGK